MPNIFISYRRSDALNLAYWVDALRAELGRVVIFPDLDVEARRDFGPSVERIIAAADAFVAVIGPSWLTDVSSSGGRGRDEREDFVRLEIATALRHNIPLLPVLVGVARMPSADELPEDLRRLANYPALAIDPRNPDVRQVADQLRRALYRPTMAARSATVGVLFPFAIGILSIIAFFAMQFSGSIPRPDIGLFGLLRGAVGLDSLYRSLVLTGLLMCVIGAVLSLTRHGLEIWAASSIVRRLRAGGESRR